MYVRPANAAVAGNPIIAPTRKWLILFDGGGGCQNADDCLWTRWCSGSGRVPPGILDRAGKMSSRGAIPAMRSPGGILKVPAPAGQEQFERYNQIWVHYCTSDNGVGSDDKTGVAPVNQPAGAAVTYDISFQGEAIVNAVIDTLLQGAATPDPAADCYDTRLPDIHDATEILIGGRVRRRQHRPQSSRSARRLADHRDPGRRRPRGARRRVPARQERRSRDHLAGDDADRLCRLPAERLGAGLAHVLGRRRLRARSVVSRSAWAADHALIGSHPQVCYDTIYTQLNHVTTPVFTRMDIDDPLGQQQYAFFDLYPGDRRLLGGAVRPAAALRDLHLRGGRPRAAGRGARRAGPEMSPARGGPDR